MNTIRQVRRLELDRRQLLVIDNARDQVFTCESGELWLTQDADRRDVILPAGRSWQVEQPGPVVLSAFKPSRVAIASAQPTKVAGKSCRQRATALLARVFRWRFPPLASFPSYRIF